MSGASPSQTIGPFFAEGMKWAIELTADIPFTDGVQVAGRVLDADGKGVADALLEIWQPHARSNLRARAAPLRGFQRVATDADGRYAFWMPRPIAGQLHADVTIFARGLLRGLFTRVYLHSAGESATFDIPDTVPADRRDSIKAIEISSGQYYWDVRLSGERETVFFDL
jgi:protocatechuate 3,4-dioxygenase alpha subunit